MDLITLYSHTLLLCTLTTILKKKNYTKQIPIVYLIVLFVYKQYNFVFINLSNYYQIISYLNTKNNIVIILILLLIFLINGLKSFKNNSIITIITLVIVYEYNFYNNNSNFFFSILEKSENILNTNLINGIMLIHPILLYIYYSYTLYYILYKTTGLKFFKREKYLTYAVRKFLFNAAYIITLSLLLGCWWAEQELSWGGWWSWDLVELIALSYLILKLIHIHKSKQFCMLLLYKFIYEVFFILVVFMSIVRFNIINSIHNFINFESTNQYYIYIIVCIVLPILPYLKDFIFTQGYVKKIKIMYNIVIKYFLILFLFSLLLIILSHCNIQIKDIYIFIILLFIVFYFNNGEFFLNKCIYIILFSLFYISTYKSQNIIYTIIYINIYIYVMLGLNTYFKKKNFHLILFFLFFICLKQIYLFSNQDCYENNNLIALYKNTSLSIETIFSTNLDLSTNLDIFKSNLFILKKIQQNNGVFLDDLNKIIFEKKVIFTKSNFLELYNYNLQMFLNANTLIIFFLFIFFLFIFFLFIFSRKKKTLY